MMVDAVYILLFSLSPFFFRLSGYYLNKPFETYFLVVESCSLCQSYRRISAIEIGIVRRGKQAQRNGHMERAKET